ncbi:hypothetical protein [Microbulbifer rhizosphaerae]|uniref:MFS superfamily sulfate permease-like transporter n=1 Tax=Microbulbifer rhizosphaerae TaxID=1562603 RepID=A0A7W4W9T5_9GAMM|nr:hypothetical protein [Microbulbifer rhizosphaerae]MBB3060286.1 MFS superfamily sulfate permease-like transporter [Microbulbifer rhizosphaerae]
MTEISTTLATICFAFATGIFTVLSLIEKPVWSLIHNPSSKNADDNIVRLVHAQLNRLIHLLPPTMKATMGGGAIFLTIQGWQRGFDWPSNLVLAVFILCIVYIISHLEKRIRAVADTRSDTDDIHKIRIGLGELAALHHIGLATTASLTILQILVLVTK